MSRNNFKKIVDFFNKSNMRETDNFIHSVGLLSTAPEDVKRLISGRIVKERFEKGEFVFKEGDHASCLYLVEEGSINCFKEDQLLRTIQKGESLGLIGALGDGVRTLSAVAGEQSTLYSLSFESLRSIIGENYKEILLRQFISYSLSLNPLFNSIINTVLEALIDNMRVEWHSSGDTIIPEGQQIGKSINLVIEGAICASKNSQAVCNKGQILFQSEILSSKLDPVDDNYIAYPDCLIANIMSNQLESIGAVLGQSNRRNSVDIRHSSLEKVRLFKMLSSKKFKELMKVVEKVVYQVGDKVISEGESGNSMFFIGEGEVEVEINGKYVRTLTNGSYFGERSLFFNEARSATITAKTTVVAFILDKDILEKIFDIDQIEFFSERLHLQDVNITLDQLTLKRRLGEGSYGKVFEAVNNETKFVYALKMISVDQVNLEKLHENIDLERKLLLQVDHPFIVKLVKTLKQNNYIYFLMEHIQGEDLFTAIRVIGLLDKEQTQFYGASLLLMAKYLKEKKIVFRDFKPENVMVCLNGYCKLIDFGTATQVKDRTFTIIGTPHYMAPELLTGKGYSYSVDMWSIAVTIYEFLCGNLPFAESVSEPSSVYSAILHDEVRFPKFVKDEKFRHLLKKMLTKNIINRLIDFENISQHPWFEDFSINKLEEFKIKPNYKPKQNESTKKEIDTTVDQVEKSDIFRENLEGANQSKIETCRKKYAEWYEQFS